jgi:hypothetical protein
VVSDTNWAIRAIADMDGDGDNDLLWQNDQIGLMVVWLMAGTSLWAPASSPTTPCLI